MAEAKKHLFRILSNYTRLLTTLAFGIFVVPLTLRWLGDDAFGIITLLGANIGLAGVFRQIIQNSLVRELGHAYHADDETFHQSYATICTIAFIGSLLSAISFGIILALIPLLKIPDEFISSARWFVIGQGAYTTVMTLLAPILNMYLVKEQFVGYNIWYIGVRTGNILSIIILGYIIAIDDPALGLALHGLTWGGLAILGMIIAAIVMVRSDRRLKFRFKGGSKEARSQVLSTFSWNTAVQVAMNLHEQIPPLLLNLFYGTFVNAAWGIGFRFVAYIRMVTTGVQFGSDAVSARMASGDDSDESRKQLQRLISIQTKLTSMLALPAVAIVFVYGWPIFDIWVGKSLEDYNTIMPVAVYMSRILSIALAARAISDTWLMILYGSGFVKSYAPWVFAGGIFAPIASVVLMLTLTLPSSMIMYIPPTMFAIVLVVVHLFGLPVITGKCLHIKPSSLLLATVRPAIAVCIAIVCSLGVLMATDQLGSLGFSGTLTQDRAQLINWIPMLSSLFVFALVYSVSSFIFVLDSAERQRIVKVVRRSSSAKG